MFIEEVVRVAAHDVDAPRVEPELRHDVRSVSRSSRWIASDLIVFDVSGICGARREHSSGGIRAISSTEVLDLARRRGSAGVGPLLRTSS